MKTSICIITSLVFMVGCAVHHTGLDITTCSPDAETPKDTTAIQSTLRELCRQSVPGSALALSSETGMTVMTAGYANLEKKIPMQECHVHYLQSVSKTYCAVAILQLYEAGKIALDSSIASYLPEQYLRHITRPREISVRMLLNHTSGVPEYNLIPAYVTRLLQQPEYPFTPEDYLRYVKGKPLAFEPGTKYAYTNTNYVLLALIIDHLTGDHARYIGEHIFKPLQLSNTYYRTHPEYLRNKSLVSAYWDRYGNGILENASKLQRNNVARLIGDDGIVATPADAVTFLKGLMEGRLLSPATLQEMMTWVKDAKGNNRYGLGLAYGNFNGKVAYGHSGGGIGAGCQLYYIPEEDLYFFAAINLGTVTDSPIHVEAGKTLEKLYAQMMR